VSNPQGKSRHDSIAATTESRGLTEYQRGFLDGLLKGTSHADDWLATYTEEAEAYLERIGHSGWKVKVSRV
jgi:hypothetical protein